MRFLVSLILIFVTGFTGKTFAQAPASPAQDSIYTAEAACGQCRFHLAGSGCDLAVKINGKAYFVEGTNIDDHGDAHAADGFCKKIRQATVTGHFSNEKFIASKFALLPEKKENE
ncbi:MAG: DUF6370 family protein [Ferruginibacter sp.]